MQDISNNGIKSILITGGAGTVGKVLLKQLLLPVAHPQKLTAKTTAAIMPNILNLITIPPENSV